MSGLSLTRRPGWQARLTQVLAQAARGSFAPGRQDCALFAGRAVEAMTGAPVLTDWEGRYASIAEGLALLRTRGFASHIDLVAQLLPEATWAEARPGDLATLTLGRDLPSLGVACNATRVYVLVEDGRGLMLLPPEPGSRVFKVGFNDA